MRLLAAIALAVTAPLTSADVPVEEALETAFPDAERFERSTAFLTESQAERVATLSGVELSSKIVTYFTALDAAAGETIGAAFLDTHLVRTKPETLLVSVEAPGAIRRVDVLSFLEPPEYRVSGRWLAQLEGRPLDDELQLRRAVRTVSGATLSSRSATDASRRALALFEVLIRDEGGEP